MFFPMALLQEYNVIVSRTLLPEITMDYKHHVFLSYSRKDSEIMRRVRDSLRDAGLSVWVDENIEPGIPNWKWEIVNSIKSSYCFIVLLSPDAAKSHYVYEEVEFAEKWNIKIFPALIHENERDSSVFGLSNTQHIDLHINYDTGIQKLISAIRGYLNPAESLDASLDLSKLEKRRKKEYELQCKWRKEGLEEELSKAEQNNDVVAFEKAQRGAELDLGLLAIDLDLQSTPPDSKEAFLLRRKRILLNLRFQWMEHEINDYVKGVIESQHDAEREAWQLEDHYEVLHEIDTEAIEEELYKEAVDFVRGNGKGSAFDLRWHLLIKPERAARFINKMLETGVLDPRTKKATERGDGWEFDVRRPLAF